VRHAVSLTADASPSARHSAQVVICVPISCVQHAISLTAAVPPSTRHVARRRRTHPVMPRYRLACRKHANSLLLLPYVCTPRRHASPRMYLKRAISLTSATHTPCHCLRHRLRSCAARHLAHLTSHTGLEAANGRKQEPRRGKSHELKRSVEEQSRIERRGKLRCQKCRILTGLRPGFVAP
jgi:hypothetical protein